MKLAESAHKPRAVHLEVIPMNSKHLTEEQLPCIASVPLKLKFMSTIWIQTLLIKLKFMNTIWIQTLLTQ